MKPKISPLKVVCGASLPAQKFHKPVLTRGSQRFKRKAKWRQGAGCRIKKLQAKTTPPRPLTNYNASENRQSTHNIILSQPDKK